MPINWSSNWKELARYYRGRAEERDSLEREAADLGNQLTDVKKELEESDQRVADAETEAACYREVVEAARAAAEVMCDEADLDRLRAALARLDCRRRTLSQ